MTNSLKLKTAFQVVFSGANFFYPLTKQSTTMKQCTLNNENAVIHGMSSLFFGILYPYSYCFQNEISDTGVGPSQGLVKNYL